MFLFFLNCTKDEILPKTLFLKGVVVDEVTNEPVSDMSISYTTCVTPNEDSLFKCEEEFNSYTFTDEKGNFALLIKYFKLSDILNYSSTGKRIEYITNKNFLYNTFGEVSSIKIEDLIDESELYLKVNKLTQVLVSIKNLNPYNISDRLEITKLNFKEKVRNPEIELYKVYNNGTENEKIDQGNNVIGDLFIWNGNNIDSSISGYIKSNYRVSIEYEVTKNGITSKFETTQKLMERGVINYFNIEY